MTAHARILPALVGIATMLFGLVGTPMAGTPVASPSGETTTYHATFSPLNSDANGGDVSGEAVITVSGDEMTIEIDIDGAAPTIQHWQHFHGFADSDQAATCPTMDDDANGDGYVDLIETEAKAGTTMVPFSDDPVSMDIPKAIYPTADADGSYRYEQTVSLSALEDAFSKQFDGQQLDLGKRVIFIHTVPGDTELPDSVQSLGDIPAQVTLPIACGQLESLDAGTPAATPVR